MTPEHVDRREISDDTVRFNDANRQQVELSVPKVGQGNPATLFAIKRLLLADGIFSKTILLDTSAWPARYFHTKMTQSAESSAGYTQDSEKKRTGLKPLLFGIAARMEATLRRRWSDRGESSPELLIGVQEHQFGAYTKEELKKLYPKGVFLYIPDVFPKESAVEMMKSKEITPLVWNKDAFDELKERGLSPILVAPVLPLAFHHDGVRGKEQMKSKGPEPYVLIKTSGSGIPDEYLESLIPILDDKGIAYQIWYPDRVVSSERTEMLQGSFEDQTSTFYSHLLAHPPQVLISYPSEMVQVAATLRQIGTQYLTLPPRGSHEKRNARFASKGSDPLETGKLKFEKLSSLRRKVLHAWYARDEIDASKLAGIGTQSLIDLVKERLEE
jgi:hypothetical protein